LLGTHSTWESSNINYRHAPAIDTILLLLKEKLLWMQEDKREIKLSELEKTIKFQMKIERNILESAVFDRKWSAFRELLIEV
jgi:hypothetical protein